MNYTYSIRDPEQESKLYQLLMEIKRIPGALLGQASLDRLFYFTSGYEYAVMERENYRLHFDKEFQMFIQDLYLGRETLHWNQIIGEGRSDEEAFFEFYKLLGLFLTHTNANE